MSFLGTLLKFYHSESLFLGDFIFQKNKNMKNLKIKTSIIKSLMEEEIHLLY